MRGTRFLLIEGLMFLYTMIHKRYLIHYCAFMRSRKQENRENDR